MGDNLDKPTDARAPRIYRIRIAGQLDASWAAWFDGLTISHAPDGATRLAGSVRDQSALYGLIDKARDLGLTLVSVVPCTPVVPAAVAT